MIWFCSSQFHLRAFGFARWTSFRKYFETPYRIFFKICFLSFFESRIAMKQHWPTKLWSKDIFLKFCVSWEESGQRRFRTNWTNSSANEFVVLAKYLKSEMSLCYSQLGLWFNQRQALTWLAESVTINLKTIHIVKSVLVFSLYWCFVIQ